MSNFKKIVFTTAISMMLLGVSAQTDVSGLISSNTVWSVSGSPYHIVGNTLVNTDITLSIDPGVQVLVDPGFYLYIDGTLSAQGTVSDSIVFKGSGPDSWVGIKFRPASVGNAHELSYCLIRDAETAIVVDGCSPSITHCSVCYNSTGIEIVYSEATPVISYNYIAYNTAYGIDGQSFYGSNYDILYNVIVYNGNGINIDPFTHLQRVNYNVFGFNGYGIYLKGGGIMNEINNNIFVGNNNAGLRIYNLGTALIVSGSINNNAFLYNGIGFQESSINANIKYNTFLGNDVGFQNDEMNSIRNLYFNYNNVSENTLYGFNHLCPWDVNAAYCWWGSTDSAIVANSIYDFYDDFDLGRIFTDPLLLLHNTDAPIAPPVQLHKTSQSGGTAVLLIWPASPESDIDGYKIYWHPINCCTFTESVDVGNVNSYTLSGVSYNDVFAVTAYDVDANGTNDQTDGHESWFTYDQLNSTIGVGEQVFGAEGQLDVFPNPTSDYVYLKSKIEMNKATLCVNNIFGAQIMKLENLNGDLIHVFCGNLPNGLYLFSITQESVMLGTARVVVSK